MNLSERERELIAQRAAGSYAVIPLVKRIVTDHKKNRNLDDQVFLEFARLVSQKSFPIADYEKLQKRVLAIIPHPFGPPPDLSPRASTPEKVEKPKRRQRKCGICGTLGHNARGCPNKPDTPTMTHDDGIERLTPGFDPNPPGETE